MSLILKIKIPSGNRIGLERLPTGALIIADLISFEIIFSFNHPKSPPLIADVEILKLLATLSNPSILILFFNSLISISNLFSSTAFLIKIS